MDSVLGNEILKLRCNICNNLLSVGPIKMNLKGENICGRCPNKTETTRNLAYEALASKLKFPCRFEGCNENVPWAKVKKHEDVCPHRPYDCLLKDCNWSGKIVQICPHFKEKHEEMYINGSECFLIDCNVDLDFIMVNCSHGKTFIFHVICKSGQLQFSPFYFGSTEKIDDIVIKIKLENKHENLTLIKEVKEVLMYDCQNYNSGIPVVFEKTLPLFFLGKVTCSFMVELNCVTNNDFLLMSFSKKCCCPCNKLIEFDYYLETVSNDDAKFPCIHEGCEVVLRKKDIYSHTSGCKHRLFKCKRTECGNNKFIFKDLVEHYITKHEANRHDGVFTWGWDIKNLKSKKICISYDAVIAYDTIFDDHSKITYSDVDESYTVTFDIKEIRLKKFGHFKFKIILLHQKEPANNIVMETIERNCYEFQLSLTVKDTVFFEYVNSEGEFCCDIFITKQ